MRIQIILIIATLIGCKTKDAESDLANNGSLGENQFGSASVRIAIDRGDIKGMASGSLISSSPPRILTAGHNVVRPDGNVTSSDKVEVFMDGKWHIVQHIDVNVAYIESVKINGYVPWMDANSDEAILTLDHNLTASYVYSIAELGPQMGDTITYRSFGERSPMQKEFVAWKEIRDMREGTNVIKLITERSVLYSEGPLTLNGENGSITTSIGDSGGTILNDRGELIGVVSGGDIKETETGDKINTCYDNNITEPVSKAFITQVLAPCQCGIHKDWCIIFRPGSSKALIGDRNQACSLDDCKARFSNIYYNACGGNVSAY